jgi:hypothetical protein
MINEHRMNDDDGSLHSYGSSGPCLCLKLTNVFRYFEIRDLRFLSNLLNKHIDEMSARFLKIFPLL